ncbi:MAG: hypothetical protein AABY66_06045, partial [Nitrospirota bacterium]
PQKGIYRTGEISEYSDMKFGLTKEHENMLPQSPVSRGQALSFPKSFIGNLVLNHIPDRGIRG